MSAIKIAIISKDKNLARLLELEAKACDLSADVFQKCPDELSEFDFVVCDLNMAKRAPSLDLNRTLLILQDGEIPEFCRDAMVMSWPFEIERLRQIYLDIKSRPVENKKACSDGGDVIYFFRDQKNTVMYKQRSIALSDSEYRILSELCQNYDNPISRERLNVLLGAEKGNIADVYIYKLRKKLEKNNSRLIFTLRFKGYKITVPMEWK